MLKDYPSVVEDKKSVRKPVKDVYIPDKDENISTREVSFEFTLLTLSTI